MKLIFINRYFHPDHSATSQMLSGIAFGLASAGQDVRIITSRQRYDAPETVLPARESIEGVKVIRVWTTRFGRSNLAGRAIDYLTFYVTAGWALLLLARKGDVVVAKTDPPMLSVMAAPIARWRGAHLVNWLQDIFPEVAQALGMGGGRLPSLAFGLLRRWRDRSLKAAAMNVVLGERMGECVAALGVPDSRVRIVPNWADGDLVRPIAHAANKLRAAWGLTDAFVVAYSGNLGRAHDVRTMLQAIEQTELAARGRKPTPGTSPPGGIAWLFVGGGAGFESLQQEVKRLELGCVLFQPYQPNERLSESLSAADVHLISLRPELEGLIVPSKVYGVMAAGRPSIFIGDSDGEVARVLARSNGGITAPQGDGLALACAVLAMAADPEHCRELGINARRAFEGQFDKQMAIGHWIRLLAELND